LSGQVAFGRGAPEHVLAGVVTSAEVVMSPEDNSDPRVSYRIELSSAIALLDQQVDCRIFQDQDVKEIVSGVLSSLGVGDKTQSWRLSGQYPKREYTVQYNESALAFVSRLL